MREVRACQTGLSSTLAPSRLRYAIWPSPSRSMNDWVSMCLMADPTPPSTMRAGRSVINLRCAPQGSGNRWARVILRVQGVDALYQHLRAQGLHPSAPKSAEWGERYVEISDPEGDVISFAEILDASISGDTPTLLPHGT